MKSFKLAILFLSLAFVITGCDKDSDEEPNAVPSVNAGVPKIITLPVNTVTMSGTATDDGQVVAYLWSQVSGPAPTTIVNPGSQSTAINGFVQGSYVFQLMATDNMGATGVDTALVIVNPGVTHTLNLQPANNPNERGLLTIGGSNQGETGNREMVIAAWTVGSNNYTGRSAFKFDLSTVPQNSTIISANLFLWSNTPPENGNLVDANFGASNSLLLQQITASWTPASTTWNNQPPVNIANQIVIPHTTQTVLDLNIDVKNMVTNMVANNANHGFLIRLQNEVTYNSRMLVSSYNTPKPDKLPKLVVVYQ